MYNDPNTGEYQWGSVIQDMLRNFMTMQIMGMMGDNKQDQGGLASMAMQMPERGMEPAQPMAGQPSPMQPPMNIPGQAPGGLGQQPFAPPQTPPQGLDPQLLQMLMQMLGMPQGR